MIPMECIVRGYITGSGWESYQKDGTICGINLPAGLKESEKLPEPIFTPSTKAELGNHDENVSLEQGAEVLEKEFPGHGREYAEKVRDYTLAIYKKCADYALKRGIIIADTKFEFGLDEDGNTYYYTGTHEGLRVHSLADEVLQHGLRHIKVRNNAVLHRTDSHDVARRTANHLLCFLTYSQDFARITLNGHNRRLTQNNASALYMHQRISRTQVDTHIMG